jgi:methionyl-tRNA synthetase
MNRKQASFYITTPIYYVNADPHLGHAYTTIAADVASRHARRKGDDTFFLTGTDEHGANVQRAAAAAGMTPKEWADPVAERFRGLARAVGAHNDFFIRTTDPQHEAFVQAFVSRLREHGDLYEGTYSGLYCTPCEAFYRPDDLVDGNCPQHGIPVHEVEERNTFFRLSAYAAPLLAHFDANPEFVLPASRMNETRSFVAAGLDDISITRQSVSWGVPLPWDREQAIYVWIDALLNYVSALTYARPGEDLTASLWPARWQLLGKDILRFHAVIWPALLLAAGYEPPCQLFIHGMLLGHDGYRMSKTRGNGMDPYPAIETYGADAVRFYLLREVAFGQDGPVGYATLHDRYHADLANELGNLLNRTVAMVGRYRDGVLLATDVDADAAELGRAAAAGFDLHMERLDFTGALEQAWTLVRALNRFVEEQQPWQLARAEGPEAARRLDVALATLVDGCRLLAVLLAPFLPSAAGRMLRSVGEAEDAITWDRARPGLLAPGTRVDPSLGPLFPRVDAPPIAA